MKPAGPFAPSIPCAKCGESLPFDKAVKTTLRGDPDTLWVGYTHATPCKERAVRRHAEHAEKKDAR